MSRMLLSIEPRFVERIMDGSKIYEFRKVRNKKDVTGIVIYSTSPVMKVVGEADVKDILVDDPETIWDVTKDASGITKEFFDQYYNGRDVAIAYELINVRQFVEPMDLVDYGVSAAPQSFVYLNDAARCSLPHNRERLPRNPSAYRRCHRGIVFPNSPIRPIPSAEGSLRQSTRGHRI